MTNLIVFGLILGTILQPIVVLSQSQTFRAAIALYKLNETYKVPDEEVTENIGNYVKYIELVKDKADILIFPEYGLTTTDVMLKPAIHLDDYSTVVKDVGYQYNNCSLDDNLGKIACAAKANGVYVVLNLVEKVDAATFFVSNVAIDSTGTISMKCRKQHLNNGTSFKQAPNENSCTFTAKFKTVSTSFAVVYETDIFYAIPDDLKKDNVIMTSAIKNTLPFEYGASLHTGFAINNNVNLLVSAYSDHKQKTNGYGGSGIYLKNGTSTLILDAISDHFLIKEIPLNADSSSKKSVSANIKGSAPGWNLAYLKASHFPNSNKSVQECLEGKNFCCKLEADIAQDNIEPYKWVILQNTSTLLNQQVDVFICALVKPAATTKTLTFRNVNVTSTVMNHHVLQTIPIGVNSNFSLPKFEYSNGRTDEVSLKLLQADELLSFGIIRILLQKLSNAAIGNKIYVVVNLVEKAKNAKNETIYYNTNVMFDKNGKIGAKYRKKHLYDEPLLTPGDQDESQSVFSTDFGVTFGMVICYDMCFYNPSRSILANSSITDVISSSAWYAALPFYHSLSYQLAYAQANNINLLASNLNFVTRGMSGSGIYGPNGTVFQYALPGTSVSKLLISTVKNTPRNDVEPFGLDRSPNRQNLSTFPSLRVFESNLYKFQMVSLSQNSEIQKEVCHGSFCCSFDLTMGDAVNSSEVYQLMAYTGPLRSMKDTIPFVRICSLLACESADPSSCGTRAAKSTTEFSKIAVRSDVPTGQKDFFQPLFLTTDLLPVLNTTYGSRNDKCRTYLSLETTRTESNVLAFGIYGSGGATFDFSCLVLVVMAVVNHLIR